MVDISVAQSGAGHSTPVDKANNSNESDDKECSDYYDNQGADFSDECIDEGRDDEANRSALVDIMEATSGAEISLKTSASQSYLQQTKKPKRKYSEGFDLSPSSKWSPYKDFLISSKAPLLAPRVVSHESSQTEPDISSLAKMKQVLFIDMDNWVKMSPEFMGKLSADTFVWTFYGGGRVFKEPE